MIIWLATKLGMSQLIVKVILFAVVSGGILLCLRWWGNAQWAKGQVEGRYFAINELKKAKEVEWKAREESIAQAAKDIATDRKQLDLDRAALGKSLRDGIAASRIERGRISEIVNLVPDSERNAAIRAALRELAAQ